VSSWAVRMQVIEYDDGGSSCAKSPIFRDLCRGLARLFSWQIQSRRRGANKA